MSKISIDLDLAVVQKALHAKVQPAVDKILSGYDLSAMIVRELERPVEMEGGHMAAMSYMIRRNMLQAFGGDKREKPEPMVVGMIIEAIHASAKEYVKENLAKEKKNIEAAFRKMLDGSRDKLAQSFVNCLDDSLAHNWRFELETTASVKEPERDYD